MSAERVNTARRSSSVQSSTSSTSKPLRSGLLASMPGFFSSQPGMEDLRYMGNRHVAEWTGCPPEALERLGVAYEDAPDDGRA